jgi:spermidine synthase
MRTQAALAEPTAGLVVTPRSWWSRFLISIYFLTGLTSIVYEVLWVRMLGLEFGVSIFGVIITVAAFMAGLGGGSLLGASLAARLQRPLLWFAVLEGLVALYALAMPSLTQGLDTALGTVAVSASLQKWFAVQAAAAFMMLFVPALAMGVGFFLVVRTFSVTRVSLAKIYGINTLGGAVGALLPLVLLPGVGWDDALYFVVSLALFIAAAAAMLAIFFVPPVQLRSFGGAPIPNGRPAATDLILYAGIGAAALMLEVAWTRLYGMIFLRTEYVLAVILCVFLIGVGVGSLWVRGHPRPSLLAWLPSAVASFALLGLWGFPLAAAWADRHQDYSSLSSALLWQGSAIMALTLPVTVLLGAWLPLLSNRLEEGGHVSGTWLYGANSLGAACGALIGGFVLIPWLGTTGTIIVAALILFGCGLIMAGTVRRAAMSAPLLALLAWPVASLPPVDKILPVTLPQVRDLAVYEDALSITHVVGQQDGQRLLLTDLRRMDASSDPTAVIVQENQARLPLLLHPAPRKVLFLGLGTGISAAGALPFPGVSLTAVEISSGAIHAARQWFEPVNAGVMGKMRVVRDDARRFLRADTFQYDVIIGDLFHPDLVGRGNLLSVQEFRRARGRLAPGGLFVQWLALNQFDVSSLRIVLRSFKQAFPHAMLFVDGFRLALVGPKDEWQGSSAILESAMARPSSELNRETGGEGIWTWLGRYWGKIPDDKGPIEDEWHPIVEFLLPRARYNGGIALAKLLEYLLATRPGLEQAKMDLMITPDISPKFEQAYIAAELATRSWEATLRGGVTGSDEAQHLLRLAYEANHNDRSIGLSLADQMLESLPQAVAAGRDRRTALLEVLAISPDHLGVLKALWHLENKAGNIKMAEYYRERIQQLSPLDRDVLVSGLDQSGLSPK